MKLYFAEVQSGLKELAVTQYDAHELAPADVFDPVIEAYKKDLDLGLIRENLKRTVEQRMARMQDAADTVHAIRRSRGFSDAISR
jgi:hypothetical protein